MELRPAVVEVVVFEQRIPDFLGDKIRLVLGAVLADLDDTVTALCSTGGRPVGATEDAVEADDVDRDLLDSFGAGVQRTVELNRRHPTARPRRLTRAKRSDEPQNPIQRHERQTAAM